MKDRETFRVLDEYLTRVGDDVQGRTMDVMPVEIAALLRAFAAGGLPAGERTRVADILKRHPRWVSVLAGEAKALRVAGESEPED